jgi:hypothetical protein
LPRKINPAGQKISAGFIVVEIVTDLISKAAIRASALVLNLLPYSLSFFKNEKKDSA